MIENDNKPTPEILINDLNEEELMSGLTMDIKRIFKASEYDFAKVFEKFKIIHKENDVTEKDFIERILDHEVFENLGDGLSQYRSLTFQELVVISAVSVVEEYYSIYYPIYSSNSSN